MQSHASIRPRRDIQFRPTGDRNSRRFASLGAAEPQAEQIEELTTKMGAGRLVVACDAWTAPAWLTRKNMTLFAEEVMPRFRPPGGKPIWDRGEGEAWKTVSEYGARVEDPVARPTSRVAGTGKLDIRTAHVPELRIPLKP